MTLAIHVTHEAVRKIGGIGAVLKGSAKGSSIDFSLFEMQDHPLLKDRIHQPLVVQNL